jgi:hypothetical protein
MSGIQYLNTQCETGSVQWFNVSDMGQQRFVCVCVYHLIDG